MRKVFDKKVEKQVCVVASSRVLCGLSFFFLLLCVLCAFVDEFHVYLFPSKFLINSLYRMVASSLGWFFWQNSNLASLRLGFSTTMRPSTVFDLRTSSASK